MGEMAPQLASTSGCCLPERHPPGEVRLDAVVEMVDGGDACNQNA